MSDQRNIAHQVSETCPAVFSIQTAEGLQALSHPTRVAMLEALHEPRSAAAVGRELGQTRQRMTYHLKALEQAGLVERVGTRQNGNFVETLFRAAENARECGKPDAARKLGNLVTAIASGWGDK